MLSEQTIVIAAVCVFFAGVLFSLATFYSAQLKAWWRARMEEKQLRQLRAKQQEKASNEHIQPSTPSDTLSFGRRNPSGSCGWQIKTGLPHPSWPKWRGKTRWPHDSPAYAAECRSCATSLTLPYRGNAHSSPSICHIPSSASRTYACVRTRHRM